MRLPRNTLYVNVCCVLVLSAALPRSIVAQEAPLSPETYLTEPEVDVSAVRIDTGSLTLHWRRDADSVVIYMGDRPDRIDHSHPLLRVRGQKGIVVNSLDPAVRHYFELDFRGHANGAEDGQRLRVAERFLPLQGAANFRDIGGYSTADGRHVRWGKVFRASTLSNLTPMDLDYLSRNLALHLVCDFRGASEIAAAPDRLPQRETPVTLNLPIAADGKELRPLFAALLSGKTDQIDDAMAQSYIRMVDTDAMTVFGPYLARLADPANLPMVDHCTAGKDRTGIATALLLSLLGVPDDTVVADYSLSNRAFHALMDEARNNRQLSAAGLTPEKLAPVIIANPLWMRRTLQHIRQTYGTVDGYLKQAAGLDDATLARIRVNLLE